MIPLLLATALAADCASPTEARDVRDTLDAAYRQLESLDIGGFKAAECAAELKNRVGWSRSKIGGYESPPSSEVASWRLEEQYDLSDMRSWLQRAKKAPQSK